MDKKCNIIYYVQSKQMYTRVGKWSMHACGGGAWYSIDAGAYSHLIEEVDALHDYIPFKVPRMITTAENSTIQAFGLWTLKFAMHFNGKEAKGELQNTYYIPELHHQLISVRKPFSHGWEPQLSRNGFAVYDTKERLVTHTTLRNGRYPLTLQTIYPDFGLVADEADTEVLDEKLHECLENGDEYPLPALSVGKKWDMISAYDWHRRMGHHSIKTVADMANGAVTPKDIPEDLPKLDGCPSCALAKAQ
jgi:hypothetical protein